MNILTELFPTQPSQSGDDIKSIIKNVISSLVRETELISEAVKNLTDDNDRFGRIGRRFGESMDPLRRGVVELDPEVAAVVQSMHDGNELGLRSPFDVTGNDKYLSEVATTTPQTAGDSFIDKEQAQLRVAAAFADMDYSVTLPVEYRKQL